MSNLPMRWSKQPLSELVEKIIDYRGKTPKKLGLDWSKDGKYRALSAKTVKTGGLVNEEQINLGDEELYTKWMKDEIKYNDILLTSEAPMGEVLIWKSEEKIILSQRLFAIRIKESVSPDYIYYYFISKRFQGELLARASGTTVIGIKQTELLKTHVILPEYKEQKAIANILTSFDNKIELLKEQNKTFEYMAHTIFNKSIQNKANLQEVPLGELVNIKYGKDHKHLKDGDYPLYGSGGIMRYVEKPLYEKESILIPRKGTLGNLFFAKEPFWSVDTIFYTEINETKVFPIYLYYVLKRLNLANLNVGSAVPSLTTKVLNAVKLNIPDIVNQKETVDSLKVLNKKSLHNISQIKTLEKMRDTLLPKLINGSIKVNI